MPTEFHSLGYYSTKSDVFQLGIAAAVIVSLEVMMAIAGRTHDLGAVL